MAALLLLDACVTAPSKYARPSGVNPANDCRVFPITQYMWREGYSGLLNAQVEPDWMYPAYAGAGTVTWLMATPFLPVIDALTMPLWAGQTCTWDKTLEDIKQIPG